MMTVIKSGLVFTGVALLSFAVSADVKLAAIFNDGLVLQQGRPVPVWGTASVGEKVQVTFGGQSVTATADVKGEWMVRLSPLAVSRESRELVATGAKNVQKISDVLVGEVWLCSGQSNMSMAMWVPPYVRQHGNRELNGALDILMVDEPLVRGCTVPAVWATEPKELAKQMEWQRFAPGKQQFFSALAFHYALTLHHSLKVPVGVIVSAWGGTNIETWISPDGYRSVPKLAKFAESTILAHTPTNAPKMELHKQPRALWNAMIHPLVPFAIRGALWYQGESNRGQGLAYMDYLHALWNGWSRAFENPGMSFYLVQIAPFDYGMKPNDPKVNDCDIWEAEARFPKENKHAAMVSIVDVGEHDNIHPGDKRTISVRLAALALHRDYGRTDIPCYGPELKSCVVEKGAVKLTFDHAGAWVLHGCDPAPFEVAGADGKFVPAAATYKNQDEIVVQANGVPEPKQLRYLWNWHGVGRLKNAAGLPLAPFYIRSL